jgi:hypothetical protein
MLILAYKYIITNLTGSVNRINAVPSCSDRLLEAAWWPNQY